MDLTETPPASVLGLPIPVTGPVLAVCAHPDDESFGLGAVLAALTEQGLDSDLICFTHGEASTLGAGSELGDLRARELIDAGADLGVTGISLLDYPDGALTEAPLGELADHVEQHARQTRARTLLVFDLGGITGHPDHCQATAAALEAADRLDLPVLAWALPVAVAAALNAEFGTAFVGRDPQELDYITVVDRNIQAQAIARHASQSADNPVLRRRLELLGPHEHLRFLRRARA